MFNKLYNFDKSSEELFLDLIYQSTGVDLNINEIVIGQPQKVGLTLTKIPVSAVPGSNLKGTVELTYERINLNSFFYGIPLKIETTEVVDETIFSQFIKDRWFVQIDPEDIEITTVDYGQGLPKELTIVAKETSIAWVGNLSAWVVEPNHMSTIFGGFDLIFTDNTLKRNAYIYSIEKELIDPPIEMINYAIGGRIIHTLTSTTVEFLNNLSTLSGDSWTLVDNVEDFNLKNAEVTYHGPLNGDNTTFVIVIELTTLCKNLFGNLIIRYNP